MKAIGELSLTRSGLKRQGQIAYMKDLPDEMVLSRIIEPLSHPVRFSMIKALSRGGMSYKELSTLTGYKGGHLLFHVTRLIEAELVAKDATSGQYLITEKGFGLIEMIKKMYSGL
jgi:predicted transcriptional regulator